MTTSPIFPWQQTVWQQLMVQRQQLPHALLFAGSQGIGKQQLIHQIAKSLLCGHPDLNTRFACGQCQHCHLIDSGNHPDLLSIAPENNQKIISIDEIRELVQFAQLTPQLATCRVVLLHDAHSMQAAAANALLKTLEEPAQGVYLLLQTAYPLQLLPTLRSRCQRIDIPLPSSEIASSWLATQQVANMDYNLLLHVARGAPLLALALAEPAVWQARNTVMESLLASNKTLGELALILMEIPLVTLLSLWHGIVNDLNKLLLDNTLPADLLIHRDYYNSLRDRATKCDIKVLQDFATKLQQYVAILQRRVALNHQLVVEDLLHAWQK